MGKGKTHIETRLGITPIGTTYLGQPVTECIGPLDLETIAPLHHPASCLSLSEFNESNGTNFLIQLCSHRMLNIFIDIFI